MEYSIDCNALKNRRELHKLLCGTLHFPEWYGHNLDALYDCLSERTDTITLLLHNWAQVEFPTPGFEAVFEQVQSENPNFTVQYL